VLCPSVFLDKPERAAAYPSLESTYLCLCGDVPEGEEVRTYRQAIAHHASVPPSLPPLPPRRRFPLSKVWPRKKPRTCSRRHRYDIEGKKRSKYHVEDLKARGKQAVADLYPPSLPPSPPCLLPSLFNYRRYVSTWTPPCARRKALMSWPSFWGKDKLSPT
jgi:hypothetical protein